MFGGARKILAIDRAICAAPDYLEQYGTPKHPNELRSHALLTYGFLLTGNQWKLTGPDGDHWVQPEWTLCAEVLRDAAIAGRGVALLPTFIAGDALREGALQRFPFQNLTISSSGRGNGDVDEVTAKALNWLLKKFGAL